LATVWPAQGTVLAVDETSGASNSFTVINGITSIDGIGGETITQAKTTTLASTCHTYRATIPDPGECSFDIWIDPTDAVHRFVRDLADSPSNGPNYWLATMNTGNTNSTCQFLGSGVSDFSGYKAGDVEDNLMATFAVKRTGPNVWVNS
jgi:hypothetical protein